MQQSNEVDYRFRAPRELWNDWKDSIPRSVSLDQRIIALIQIDAALDGETNVANMILLRMKLERIQQRSQTARQALQDGDGPKVRAELEQIDDIAADLIE